MGKSKIQRIKAEPQQVALPVNRDVEAAYWKKVWDTVQETASKSEDNIDKKVFALSVGAIGLELTLFEIIGDKSSDWKELAFISAALFVLALASNLINHLYGRFTQARQTKMIKDFLNEEIDAFPSHVIYSKMESHSKCVLLFHCISSALVILGIALLFVYSYLKLS